MLPLFFALFTQEPGVIILTKPGRGYFSIFNQELTTSGLVREKWICASFSLLTQATSFYCFTFHAFPRWPQSLSCDSFSKGEIYCVGQHIYSECHRMDQKVGDEDPNRHHCSHCRPLGHPRIHVPGSTHILLQHLETWVRNCPLHYFRFPHLFFYIYLDVPKKQSSILYFRFSSLLFNIVCFLYPGKRISRSNVQWWNAHRYRREW